MASGTVLSICNRALLSVGARAQISSVSPSDGSVEADACSVLFTPTFEALARTAQWNCLGAQTTLSMLMAAQGTPENPNGTTLPLPPTPWLYAYAYPSDCLDIRYVVPSLPSSTGSTAPATTINNSAGTWLPSGGQIPYVVTTVRDPNTNTNIEVILTNQSQAQAVYTTSQVNPAGWDSLFQQAMVASLGTFLVPALSLNIQLMQMSMKTADMAIAQARAADGNEGVTVLDHTPDWFKARAGGGAYGIGYNISTWGGYQNMAWPAFGGGE
jgi:hypothetical protein